MFSAQICDSTQILCLEHEIISVGHCTVQATADHTLKLVTRQTNTRCMVHCTNAKVLHAFPSSIHSYHHKHNIVLKLICVSFILFISSQIDQKNLEDSEQLMRISVLITHPSYLSGNSLCILTCVIFIPTTHDSSLGHMQYLFAAKLH